MKRVSHKATFVAATAFVTLSPMSAAQAQAVASPASSDNESGAGEIVVTARKQSENLQNVPISIAVVDADKLSAMGATKLSDVASLVPGLVITSDTGFPGSVNIILRGISLANTTSTTTAITVDDVPTGSSGANGFSTVSGTDLLPYNISQIEVLKGPQGTLYGATSLGGLVRYVTKTPDLNGFTSMVGGGISTIAHGSDLGYNGRAAINVPLVDDVLAVSLSGGYAFTPGWIDNTGAGGKDFNHGHQKGARLAVYWAPTPDLTMKLSAIYNSSLFRGLNARTYDYATNSFPTGYYDTSYQRPFSDKSTAKLYIAELNYDMDWVKLTSVTGYSTLYKAGRTDLTPLFGPPPGFTVDGFFDVRTKKFSEELRLSSTGKRPFEWNAGLFYTHENTVYREIDDLRDSTGALPPAFTPYYDFRQPSMYEDIAGFANGTYRITDQWDVSAGVRYTANRQSVSSAGGGALVGGSSVIPTVRYSDSSWTYSIDSRYRFTPDVMAFLRIATGYRPGGNNTSAFGQSGVPATFGPDRTTNYELGLKSELFDHRLLFNLTAYHIDWTNAQIQQRTPALVTYVGNSGGARAKGIELTTAYKVTPELVVGVDGAFTDAKLSVAYVAVGAPKGARLPGTPKLAGNVHASWTHAIDDRHSIELTGAWRYMGNRVSNFPNTFPGPFQLGHYNTIDLTAALKAGAWKANLFVKNVADKQGYSAGNLFGPIEIQPRTIGIDLEVSFR